MRTEQTEFIRTITPGKRGTSPAGQANTATAKTVPVNAAPILNHARIAELSRVPAPSPGRLEDILTKALELKGLSDPEAAELLAVSDSAALQRVLETAAVVKKEIYGARMVLFAPLYAGNKCANECLYCGFRSGNRDIHRVTLNDEQLIGETRALLRQGHKRVLLLAGETGSYGVDFIMHALDTIYGVEENGAKIRRINVEVAPMSVEDFRTLKTGGIGTYTCFQETYDPDLYAKYHVRGPKADYHYRLSVMDRAMEAGIDDVGVGVLFGLAPWKQEVISLLNHARHLERRWGCGPHTVSVPRLEPAPGAPIANSVPYPVNDEAFRLLVAVLRVTLPYTGIILSTRESKEMRDDLFRYGVSQASAGSRTTPGGYGDEETEGSLGGRAAGEAANHDTAGDSPADGELAAEFTHSQFSLADHRTLHEVVGDMVDGGFVPSFCTGCYRQGRTGADFMDLAKPGLIKSFCLPNGLSSFAEYLEDYGDASLKVRGYALIDKLTRETPNPEVRERIESSVAEIRNGSRDVYV
ncbi:MAG: [FeFe] hydrogenase H-cluster radical SAM maturase HydG [Spirochaetaceae bacterium]|nr:[FeFe] hydrogenase H-cluster radical SAM maturase HydG [Spirochaetaceae bacterium]